MNPAGRVGDIAAPARDQMDVAVKDRLPGGLADIDADVESRDVRVLREDSASRLFEQLVDRPLLLGAQIEKIGDVAPRQDQRVQRRHRRDVANGVGERVLCNDLASGTAQKTHAPGSLLTPFLLRYQSAP